VSIFAHIRIGSIVNTHRLSTVVSANFIVAVQNGRIIEQGAHAELLARAGVNFR
jgi:ABC-type transport system involved in Fe-S cluster assembly fused permease/ATPase subunit